jgi:hypothetical protein
MIHHVVAITAATTFADATRTPPARAVRAPSVIRQDGGNSHGNGHHNRNLITVRSPTHNRGYQHTSTGNAGGMNPVQNSLCRHVTVCTVNQKVIVVQPARPEPAPAPNPPIAVLHETAIPQSHPVSRPRAPFLYLGPDGFMMMGAGAEPGFGGRGLLPFGLLG